VRPILSDGNLEPSTILRDESSSQGTAVVISREACACGCLHMISEMVSADVLRHVDGWWACLAEQRRP